MSTADRRMAATPPSIVAGPPLADEPGLGELTLPSWFRSICANGGEAEALVHYDGGLANSRRVSWTYAGLWDQANAVARALIACGVGTDEEARSLPILATADGKPWKTGCGASWRKAPEEAGLEGLTFRALRGTAVTRLARAEATEIEIAAITGHSLRDVHHILYAHYLALDDEMAASAIS